MQASRDGLGNADGRRVEVQHGRQAEELPGVHSFPTTRASNITFLAQKWYRFDGLVRIYTLAIARSSRGMHTQAMK
jgi:hypothetical protein